MSYFPKVNIPNTFYVNEGAPSGGTKGNPSAPYESPWDIAGDLGSSSEVIRLTPGTFTYTGPYDANASHLPNSDETTYDAFGSTMVVDTVLTTPITLFGDNSTGAGTDEARILRLNGGKYRATIPTGLSEPFMFSFLNQDSTVILNKVESLISEGNIGYGIEIGGDLYGRVEEMNIVGGQAIQFRPGSDGSTSQVITTGRKVDLEINRLETAGTGQPRIIGWRNNDAEYGETDMQMKVQVNEFVGTDQVTCFYPLFDSLITSTMHFNIGRLKVNSADNNTVFNFGAWWSSNMTMTDSSAVFELEHTNDFSGTITNFSGLALDNSFVHVKLGRIHTLANPSGNAHIDLGPGFNLTNNSTLLISAEEFVDTGSTGISVIELRPFLTTDATSKVIITGTFRTSQAIPLVIIGETTLNIELKDVVFENDGTVAAIQRDGSETPTVNVAGAFDTNTIIAGAGVTINRYDEYV